VEQPQPSAAKGGGNTKVVLIVVGSVLGICVLGCVGFLIVQYVAFSDYVDRGKTSEAATNLRIMYSGAAAYYEQESLGVTLTARVESKCTVGPTQSPNSPGPTASVVPFGSDPSFDAIAFGPADPLYYRYTIEAGPAACGHGPDETLYTFRANGDLDGDGTLSTFEIAAGSDASNTLFRSAGIFRANETE